MAMNSDEEILVVSPDDYTTVRDRHRRSTTNGTSTQIGSNEEQQNHQSQTNGQKSMRIFLEPAVAMLFFATNLSGTVYQNQLIYQTCTVIFNFNETDCTSLMGVTKETEHSKTIEEQVQPYVASILMAKSLLDSIIPSFLSLFMGTWSDKFGRRPILLATFTGYFLSFLVIIVLTFLSIKFQMNPWFFILSSIPTIFVGGLCAVITSIYCYISDVAVAKARAYRMILMEFAIYLGLMGGSLSSSYLYEATNMMTVFSVSASVMFIAVIYVFFFVGESLQTQPQPTESKIREFFRWELVKDLIRTSYEKRPNYDRTIIWLLMLTLTLQIFVLDGDGTVSYLFVREKFEWTLREFTVYNAFGTVIQIVFSILGTILLRKVLHFSIITVALLSLGSLVLATVVKATAIYAWHMYLSVLMGVLAGVASPMLRAMLSHVVPASDIGKIFALTTSLETITPLGAAPLYTMVYSKTLTIYPGTFYFISTGLLFIGYIFIAIIYGIQKSYPTTTYEAIGS